MTVRVCESRTAAVVEQEAATGANYWEANMDRLHLEGTYADAAGGVEAVTWVLAPSSLPGWRGRYEITTQIRGESVQGADFDGLEPATATGSLSLNRAGELDHCVLSVRVPSRVDGSAGMLDLDMALDGGPAPLTTATLRVGEEVYSHSQVEILEGVLGALAQLARPHLWECCLTCGLSDYSPGGQGLMGMRCHRDAREQYLAVRTKADYWPVPVTEEVPEFYRCSAYELRIPGTGYRG